MGQIDRFRASLRIFSEEASLDHLSELLGCTPTRSRAKGELGPFSAWHLTVISDDGDVEGVIQTLLAKLTGDLAVWSVLTSQYKVDLFCGVFMRSDNRGFEMSPHTMRLLAERNLLIGFDVYYAPPGSNPTPAES